jgi:hypothetical protein
MLFPSDLHLIFVATSLIEAVQGRDIYVSPSGTGSGSQSAPYGSLQVAVNAAIAGDNILLRAREKKKTDFNTRARDAQRQRTYIYRLLLLLKDRF